MAAPALGKRLSNFPPPPRLGGRKLTPGEVGLLETFVVPRYLEKFGEAALGMMLLGPVARIAHLGCRTGYPDRELLELCDDCAVTGVDASLAAVELARNKAAILVDASLEYRVATRYPTDLDAAAYSHALCLHPIGENQDRLDLFRELERLLYSGGQALVSLPLRGSFQELTDLFREFALKQDQGEFGRAIEQGVSNRPTAESLSEELEASGFTDIDIDVRTFTLTFETGRAFVEDPVTRLMIVSELQAQMGVSDVDDALAYTRDAIGKYWAGREFSLGVVAGTASARKV